MNFKATYILSTALLFFTLAKCQEQNTFYPAGKAYENSTSANYQNQATGFGLDRFNKADEAWLFNGSSSSITIKDPDFMPLSGDFTISFWMKSDAFQRAQVFSLGPEGENLDFDIHPRTGIWAYWNGGGEPGIAAPDIVTDAKWHFIVLTRSNGLVELYLDTRKVGSIHYNAKIGSANDLILGGRPEFRFGGYLDEFSVSSSGMSKADVVKKFNSGAFFVFPNANSIVAGGKPVNLITAGADGNPITVEISYNNGNSWSEAAKNLISQDTLTEIEIRNVPSRQRCKVRLKTSTGKIIAYSESFFVEPPGIRTEYAWQKVPDFGSYAPRDGAGALTLNNEIWLLGGWNPNLFPKATTNELWKSTDGINWQSAGHAPWEERHVSGWVNFQDKLWIVGGDANQQHHQMDVWNSDNGVDWTQVVEKLPWSERASHKVVSFQNKLWMAGGQEFFPGDDSVISVYNDVWNSVDGKIWNQVTAEAPWVGRGFGGFVSYKGKLWIIGGGRYQEPREYHNDVWSSEDGVNWTQHKDAPWRPRFFHETIVYDDKIWVVGGYGDSNGNLGDVWYTSDGSNWRQTEEVPWAPRHATTTFVVNNDLFVTCGTVGNNPDSLANDIWRLRPSLSVTLSQDRDLVLPFNSSTTIYTAYSSAYEYTWKKNNEVLSIQKAGLLVNSDGDYSLHVRHKTRGIEGTSEKVRILFEPNAELNVKNDTITLGETLELEAYYDSSYSYKWFFNGREIPLQTSHRLTAIFNGAYYVEATTEYGLTKQSAEIKVEFNDDLLAQGQPNLLLHYKTDEFLDVFYFNKDARGPVVLRLVDVNGRELYSETATKSEEILYVPISIEKLVRGLFFVLVKTTGDARSKKFIKN